ncbi:MAG: type I restriction endonuclease subunit R, partial [Clostridia bacterium]|nr:type I restriction endonuclease subunit R [Clostridia bacterium]
MCFLLCCTEVNVDANANTNGLFSSRKVVYICTVSVTADTVSRSISYIVRSDQCSFVFSCAFALFAFSASGRIFSNRAFSGLGCNSLEVLSKITGKIAFQFFLGGSIRFGIERIVAGLYAYLEDLVAQRSIAHDHIVEEGTAPFIQIRLGILGITGVSTVPTCGGSNDVLGQKKCYLAAVAGIGNVQNDPFQIFLTVFGRSIHLILTKGSDLTFFAKAQVGAFFSQTGVGLFHSDGVCKSCCLVVLTFGIKYFADISVIDAVFVITDRRVLNSQLQTTILGFDHIEGQIETITDKDPSTKLRDVINEGAARIVICTLHRFPVIYQEVTSRSGKHYAIIVDEAHSSQSGKSAEKVKT